MQSLAPSLPELGRRRRRDGLVATVRHPVRLRLGGREELAGRPGPVGAARRHGHGGYPWRCSSPEEEGVLCERSATSADGCQPNSLAMRQKRLAYSAEPRIPASS